MNLTKCGLSLMNSIRNVNYIKSCNMRFEMPGCDVNSMHVRGVRTLAQRLSSKTSEAGGAQLSPHQSVVEEEHGTKPLIANINRQIEDNSTGRLFSIVFIRGKQHKITTDDLVRVQTDIGAPLGERIILEKVLGVGSRDFTMLGRPLLPHGIVSVEATIVEKSLGRRIIFQHFRRRENKRHLRR